LRHGGLALLICAEARQASSISLKPWSFQSLGDVLIRLNTASSPVWTSKCGVWANDGGEQFDADEFDAPPGGAAHTRGCYIDLLSRDERSMARQRMRLPKRANPGSPAYTPCRLRSCRADLIIRRGLYASRADAPGRDGLPDWQRINRGRSERWLHWKQR
jgi:hypothetical protein